MALKSDFHPEVALPPGLGSVSVIRRAIEYMERELADLVDLYYEQANVFSAIVGILGTKALEASKAGKRGGGRTHTFGVKEPARKLQGKAIYQRADVTIRDGKPIPKNGE